MSRRSARLSRAPSDVSSVARGKWSNEHDTKHAKLSRNYVGDGKMLRELRHPDFDEHAQHDANELRAATHQNYNEAELADEAAHTHLHTSHRRRPKKRDDPPPPEEQPELTAPAPAPAPARVSRRRKSSRSPSPAGAASPAAAAGGSTEAQEAGGSSTLPDILPWIFIGGCAYIGGTWLLSVVSAAT
jgi:hypothetical protein